MIDISKLTLGKKLGCKYTFTAGTAGTFSEISSTENDGRKVKDPLSIDGSYFTAVNAKDPEMIAINSAITMKTYREFPLETTTMTAGTKYTTKEDIDFTKYKSVIDFSSVGSVSILAIPCDQLLTTKTLINMQEFISGINTLAISITNLWCKVALTADGTNWITYDATNKKWIAVDLTATTDTLKTTMVDYTAINALVAADYTASGITNKMGVALLIGIDGTDTTKTYSVNSITLDYIGTNDSTPSIQYFNWVFAGYDLAGNAKFIADKPVQASISYTTIYNAGWIKGDTKVNIASSELPGDFYIRTIRTGISDAYPDEYDKCIVSNMLRGSTAANIFWDTNIASITSSIAAVADTTGTAPTAMASLISRGGPIPTDGSGYYNITNTTATADYGFRPVLIVDLAAVKGSRVTNTGYTVVSTVEDLAPGRCIKCEYKAAAGSIGTFSNLGTATKAYLYDYNNSSPDGTFLFNFVGYTTDGNIKLMADRVIQSSISLNQLYSANTPLMSGDGYETNIDDYKVLVRLPNALVDKQPSTKGGEYDSIVNNTALPLKTIEQIWHTAKSACWTNAQSATKSNYIIAKGFGDEVTGRTNQRHFIYNGSYQSVGFRPVVIIKPAMRVVGLQVTPYVGYEKQTGYADSFTVHAKVILESGLVGNYAIYTTDMQLVSDFSKATDRVISVTALKEGKTGLIIVEQTSGKTLKTFDVYRDTKYRSSTVRTFGSIYGGWGNTNIDVSTNIAVPNSSSIVTPTATETAKYISVPRNVVKLQY